MKDVKKLLKEQSDNILPDENVKERIRLELGFAPQTEREAAYAHGGTVSSRGTKSKLAIVAAALVIAITLCIVLPLTLGGGGGGGPVIPDFSSVGDFYAYGAAAAGAMLSTYGGTSSALALAPSAYERAEIEALTNEYMPLVESILAGNGITHSDAEVPEEYSEYDLAMTVSCPDIAGGTMVYTLYYSFDLAAEETDGDETERSYDITGVLVTGNGEFSVRGGSSSEQESDGNESENENEMWFEAYVGADSYIRVEQESETETDENETEIERTHRLFVFENGRLVESTTVDYEKEDDGEELGLEIERDGRRDSLKFIPHIINGDTVLYVEADIDGDDCEFLVYKENGVYRYEFDADFDEFD